MTDEPFIRLARGFFEHAFWEEKREYSRAEAWLDLVRSVAWQTRSTMVKGSIVRVPRGGIVASERFLSGRWMWSRTKVRAFLDLLEAEGMATREKDRESAVLFLCNFDKYNPQKDRRKTAEEPVGNQIEEGEEGKKDPPVRATPTKQQAMDYAPTAGVGPEVAEFWWLECDARPLSVSGLFTDRDGNEIRRWQSHLASYGRKWQANGFSRADGVGRKSDKQQARAFGEVRQGKSDI